MPRIARVAPGGMVFHVLNRGVGRMRLFDKEEDYAAFERILEETLAVRPMRLCCYCLMPNHWHLILWPRHDGDLAAFMQRLTVTHVTRWQEHRRQVGTGHVYQGRYKAFPIEADEHFYQVARYVERNALRANLVEQAEEWRWCSLWRRTQANAELKAMLSDWPVPRSRLWRRHVNEPQTEAELAALRRSLNRSQPFGGDAWTKRVVQRLGLESTIRPRGRPKKTEQVKGD